MIYQNTTEIQKDITCLNSSYSDYHHTNYLKTFNLDKITSDIKIVDEIIQSKYIKYLK